MLPRVRKYGQREISMVVRSVLFPRPPRVFYPMDTQTIGINDPLIESHEDTDSRLKNTMQANYILNRQASIQRSAELDMLVSCESLATSPFVAPIERSVKIADLMKRCCFSTHCLPGIILTSRCQCDGTKRSTFSSPSRFSSTSAEA